MLEGSLSYDLTVRGIGTFAVFVEDGSARVVAARAAAAARARRSFHLAGDPLALAELLAGEREQAQALPAQGARVTGRRKRARRSSRRCRRPALSLAEAVKAGARLEPGSSTARCRSRSSPSGRAGHAFTVAQQIVELAPHAWYVTARDGLPLQRRRARRRRAPRTRPSRCPAPRSTGSCKGEPQRSATVRRSAATAPPSRRSSAGRTSPAAPRLATLASSRSSGRTAGVVRDGGYSQRRA